MNPRDKKGLERTELAETTHFLKETIRRARNAEKALEGLEKSLALELGGALVDTMKSPWGAFRLPGRLLALAERRLLGKSVKGSPPGGSFGRTGDIKKAAGNRVVVAGHDLRFFDPIARSLESSGKFLLREDRWTSQDSCRLSSVREALNWADVVVAEWCLGNAVWYSANMPAGKKLIVRFHLRERASRFPDQVDWDRVDKVVFVGPHILRQVTSLLGVPRRRARFIPNAIPFERFDLKKKPVAQWTIGVLGYTPQRKRLDLALDTFEALWNDDKRWRLRIKGSRPEDLDWLRKRNEEMEWYADLRKRIDSSAWKDQVIFDPAGDDVHSWFKDVGYLLSPSDFESFHVAVGEAVASGAVPVIWPWMGSDELWPQDFVVDNTMEAVKFLSGLVGDTRTRHALVHKARAFVKERYHVDKVAEAWEELLTE